MRKVVGGGEAKNVADAFPAGMTLNVHGVTLQWPGVRTDDVRPCTPILMLCRSHISPILPSGSQRGWKHRHRAADNGSLGRVNDGDLYPQLGVCRRDSWRIAEVDQDAVGGARKAWLEA